MKLLTPKVFHESLKSRTSLKVVTHTMTNVSEARAAYTYIVGKCITLLKSKIYFLNKKYINFRITLKDVK